MSTILEKIKTYKKQEIEELKQQTTLSILETRIKNQTPPRGFLQALQNAKKNGQIGLIAEIKKASPSKGLIREDFNPPALASAYAEGGATCLSILTDAPSFQGHADYLKQARAACSLPVLRKDFMIDPYQIIESRAMGADCILIIMAMLDAEQAKELEAVALTLGMSVLIEVHSLEELETALQHLKSPLIGVNNRDLHSFVVSLEVTEQLAPHVPSAHHLVSESGIFTNDDIKHLQEKGINSFLVGESLMRQDDVAAATKNLLGIS